MYSKAITQKAKEIVVILQCYEKASGLSLILVSLVLISFQIQQQKSNTTLFIYYTYTTLILQASFYPYRLRLLILKADF